MVTTLYVIRHGETEGSDDGLRRYKGTIDVPLSAEGRRQALAVAAFIRGLTDGLDAVYASPLSRARDTAAPMAEAYGLASVVVSELRERSFGVWEGMSFGEIEAAYPDAFGSWAADPLRHCPPGGESTLEVHGRVSGAVEGLVSRHPGGTVAIVAHGGVNRVILCHYLGVPLRNIFRIEQDFACVNCIEFHEAYPLVTMMNHPAAPEAATRDKRVFG